MKKKSVLKSYKIKLLSDKKKENLEIGCLWAEQKGSEMKEGITGAYNSEFNSFPQSCPTLCDPMDCSMPGLPVHHQLPKFTQTHVH